jgi:hypothetical protein
MQPGSRAPAPLSDSVVRATLSIWAAMERRTRLPIEGRSMWPQLRDGEQVLVRHGGAEPRTGQVLVLLDRGRTVAHRTVCHRIVMRRRMSGQVHLRTKGDTNLGLDPGWIEPGGIVGVVEGVVVDGRVAKRFGLDGAAARGIAALSLVTLIAYWPIQWLKRVAAAAGPSHP